MGGCDWPARLCELPLLAASSAAATRVCLLWCRAAVEGVRFPPGMRPCWAGSGPPSLSELYVECLCEEQLEMNPEVIQAFLGHDVEKYILLIRPTWHVFIVTQYKNLYICWKLSDCL